MENQENEKMKQIANENKDKLFKDWVNPEPKQTDVIDRRTKIKSDLRQIYKRHDGSHYIKLLDAIEDYILNQ